ARLFGLRAQGTARAWDDGVTSGWRLSRRLWAVADCCARDVRPYASDVARGHPPGSLEALSRLPPELLDDRRYPGLPRLRGRLGALASPGPVLLRWSELWEPWERGEGGTDPLRLARLLEALGFALEPDPR